MTRTFPSCILFLVILFGGTFAYAQDSLGPKPKRPRTLEDYQPRTLKQLVAEPPDSESLGNKEETMLVFADISPSRVRLTSTGSTRPLSQIKKEVLRQWARLYAGNPEGYTEPYETEMKFTEDGVAYWLAMKKRAIPQMKKGMKPGEPLDVYLIRLGAAKIGDDWEPMLLVEDIRNLAGLAELRVRRLRRLLFYKQSH